MMMSKQNNINNTINTINNTIDNTINNTINNSINNNNSDSVNNDINNIRIIKYNLRILENDDYKINIILKENKNNYKRFD